MSDEAEMKELRMRTLRGMTELASVDGDKEAAGFVLQHTYDPADDWFGGKEKACTEIEMPTPFYALSVSDMGKFFIKLVIALLPAAMIGFGIYVGMLLLASAFVQMLGG